LEKLYELIWPDFETYDSVGIWPRPIADLADLANLANQARPTAKINGQNFIGIWPRPRSAKIGDNLFFIISFAVIAILPN
jgi:hypothetical protein